MVAQCHDGLIKSKRSSSAAKAAFREILTSPPLLGTVFRPCEKSSEIKLQFSCRACKPNSVCRLAAAGRSFLWAAHYCAALATYPEVVTHRAGTFPPKRNPPLFGLAPCGVCPATVITDGAVRSYRTFSPLPRLTTATHGRLEGARLQPCRNSQEDLGFSRCG